MTKVAVLNSTQQDTKSITNYPARKELNTVGENEGFSVSKLIATIFNANKLMLEKVSKTCVKGPLKNRQNKDFKDKR